MRRTLAYRTSSRTALARTHRVATATAARKAGSVRLDPVRRWWLRAALAAEVSPAFDAAWTETDSAVRRMLAPTPSSSDTIAAGTLLAWAAGEVQLDRQYVSQPLLGGVVLDAVTISAVVSMLEQAADDNATPRLGVRVVSEDGATVRETLLAVDNHAAAAELATSTETRILASAQAVTAYTTADGDRLVVEIGWSDTAGTSPRAQSRYGSSASADFALTAGLTTDLRPWLELSR